MKRNRILLVGNYLPDCQKSMNAYLGMIVNALNDSALDAEVEVIRPKKIVLPGDVNKHSGITKWLAYVDKFLIFPFLLYFKAKNYDRVHICDHSNSMYSFFIKREKVVITCHDVIAIQAAQGNVFNWTVGYTGRIFQFLIKKGLANASNIICVSNLTKRHYLEIIKSNQAVCVVYNALNNNFYYREASRDIDNEIFGNWAFLNNYILHIGSDLPRKNRNYVCQLFALLAERRDNLGLVLVGPELSSKQTEFVDYFVKQGRVKVFKNIEFSQLNYIYSRARLLLFPSTHEGFGWPIIEAQSAHCPVVTSGLAPLDEVGGAGAMYLDLESLEKDTDRVEELLESNELRDDLIKEGVLNVSRFDLSIFRKELLAIYEK